MMKSSKGKQARNSDSTDVQLQSSKTKMIAIVIPQEQCTELLIRKS